MKIKSVRAVSVNIPRTPPKTPARRDGWELPRHAAPRPHQQVPRVPPHARHHARRQHAGRPLGAGRRRGRHIRPRTVQLRRANRIHHRLPLRPTPRRPRLLRHRIPQRPHVALHAAVRRGRHRHRRPVRHRPRPLGPQGQAPRTARLSPARRTLAATRSTSTSHPTTSTGSMELGFHAFKVSNPVHYEEGIDGPQHPRRAHRQGARHGRLRRRAHVQPRHVLQRRVRHPRRRAPPKVRPPLARRAANPHRP